EGLMRMETRRGEQKDMNLVAASQATYLAVDSGKSVALPQASQAYLDASVGFGGAAPVSANLHAANSNVGINTVAGGWAYQGSRAAYQSGNVMNAQGRMLNCMAASSGRMNWRAEARGAGIGNDSQIFSPPSLGHSGMYLCSAAGHLL